MDGRGPRRLLVPQTECADELERSILQFHKERYEIGCFTIMANHCHMVIRPFDGHDLEV